MITRNQVGDVAFTVDERDELVSTLKEILISTEIGKLYKTEYFVSKSGDEDAEKILSAAIRVAGGELVSARDLVRALELLIDSGEIQPKNVCQSTQLEEPEEDLRPRDHNGKLLTPEQIAWGEMSRFAATSTADAVRQRKHVDGKFRDFIAHSLRQEMASTPVGDGVVPAGQSATKARASQELVAFAHKYIHEQTSNLRPKGGYVTLGGEQMTWSTFNDLLSRASAANLL